MKNFVIKLTLVLGLFMFINVFNSVKADINELEIRVITGTYESHSEDGGILTVICYRSGSACWIDVAGEIPTGEVKNFVGVFEYPVVGEPEGLSDASSVWEYSSYDIDQTPTQTINTFYDAIPYE